MNRTSCDSINRVYETVRDAATHAVTSTEDTSFVLADILGHDSWREIAHSWASVVPVIATLHGCVAAVRELGAAPREVTSINSSDSDHERRTYRAVATTWLTAGLEEPADEDAMEDFVTGDLQNLGWTHDRTSLAGVITALVEICRDGDENDNP